MGRYTKLKSTSGGSASGKRKTPSSQWSSPPVKKAKKVKTVEKDGEDSEKALDLRKASSKVHPPPMKKTEDEDLLESISETDEQEEDQLGGLTHSQILEMEWKKRQKKLRNNMDNSIAKRNKKHFY